MIVTVTMNPAIDKTVEVGRFVHGGLNRIQRVWKDAGGKGINVSKTIHHLGGETVAAGFVAGSAGEAIESVLREYGILTDFVRVAGETRTNMKVVEDGGVVTELNEPGPEVTEENVHELIERLERYASPETLVVLSGSIPRGVSRDVYGVITERMHAKGASVLLDADGELFASSLYAKPDMIKPNRMELEQYFGETTGSVKKNVDAGNKTEPVEKDDSKEHENESKKIGDSAYGENEPAKGAASAACETKSDDAHDASDRAVTLGNKLLEMGIGLVAVSMGGDGAVFLQKDCRIRCPGLSVKAHSTVGAGDAMVAALAMAWQQKLPLAEAAALGMATSAGAVMTTGTKPPTRELVDRLLKQVKVEIL